MQANNSKVQAISPASGDSYGSSAQCELISPDLIVISQVIVRSEDVFQFLEKKVDPVCELTRAIEAGVACLERLGNRRELEELGHRAESLFERLRESIQDFIGKNLDPTIAGGLSEKVTKVFELQNMRVKDLIVKNEGNLSVLNQKVNEFSDALNVSLRDVIGSTLASDQTALGVLLKRIEASMESIKDAVVRQKTIEEEKSTAIGEDFEERCFEDIYSWARAHQGMGGATVTVTDTRTVTGLVGKQGDAIIDLNCNGNGNHRITVEMKHQERISVPSIHKVLSESIQNRNAQKAIYVAPDATYLPREIGAWSQPSPEKIITIRPFLEMALKIASAQLELAAHHENHDGLDTDEVIELVLGIQDTLKQFNALFTSSRAVIRQSEKTLSIAMNLKGVINEKVDALLAIVRTGGRQEHEPEDQ